MFGSGLYGMVRPSAAVSMCGINMIEAQWGGLLATWSGADVVGILPELRGMEQSWIPSLFSGYSQRLGPST